MEEQKQKKYEIREHMEDLEKFEIEEPEPSTSASVWTVFCLLALALIGAMTYCIWGMFQ